MKKLELSMMQKILNNVKKNNKKPSIVFENKGLVVSNLGKRYKNRPILRGINLSQKGEIVGLLGPNGQGKLHVFTQLWD